MHRSRVALFGIIFFLSGIVPAHAATIYLEPQTGTYGLGDTFFVDVRLNSEDACVNAAQVELSYPREAMKAVDFSRGGSILSLWVEEPLLDTERGIVRFAGGIPGGYCGRTPGDPVLSNVLGRVVFTITGSASPSATINVTPRSEVYLHDGAGTKASLTAYGATLAVLPTGTQTENPWLKQVHEDTTPPDPFDAIVESTRGIFGGKYYLVFSTVDKQSGIDHYELLERDVWTRVESPHEMRDQFLRDDVQLKAIDKAGNERLATFNRETVPERAWSWNEYLLILGIVILLVLAGVYRYSIRSRTPENTPLT